MSFTVAAFLAGLVVGAYNDQKVKDAYQWVRERLTEKFGRGEDD